MSVLQEKLCCVVWYQVMSCPVLCRVVFACVSACAHVFAFVFLVLFVGVVCCVLVECLSLSVALCCVLLAVGKARCCRSSHKIRKCFKMFHNRVVQFDFQIERKVRVQDFFSMLCKRRTHHRIKTRID